MSCKIISQEQLSQGLPLKAAFFSAFLCTLFGANAVAIKISLTGFGVLTTGGIRFISAAAVILLWAVLTRKPLAINRQQAYQLAPLPFILFIQLTLFYFGQSRTYASHGTLIANLLPFVVMFLAHFYVAGDRINLQKITGLLFGFSAVFLLFVDETVLGNKALSGDFLILLSVLIWGAHVVYIKKIIANFHPVQVTVYPMLVAGPMFLLCGLIFDPRMIIEPNSAAVISLSYQVMTASFGFVAWNSMIRIYGPTALHSFIFIMPISGVFFGIVILGEPLTTYLIGSIVLVVLGLMIVNKPSLYSSGNSGK